MGGNELAFADLLDNSESQTGLRGGGQSGGDGLVTSGGAGLVVVPLRPSGDGPQHAAITVLLRVVSAAWELVRNADSEALPGPRPVNAQKL